MSDRDEYVYLPALHEYTDISLSLFFSNLIHAYQLDNKDILVLSNFDVGSIYQICAHEYYCVDCIADTKRICIYLSNLGREHNSKYVYNFFDRAIDGVNSVCVTIIHVTVLNKTDELIEVLTI